MPRGYVPIFELGRGGMGDVLLAVATGPGGITKLHVVKRLRDELAQDADFLAMFFNEARIAARIDHPNVVQTYEFGFDGECYFSTMEYLEGQSLEALFTRGGAAVPAEIYLAAVCDALAGLHHAHELCDYDGRPLRIVHRDVSPQNIFVTYEGRAKLLDFGIAKAADSVSATRTGAVKGKMAYMPPEQIERTETFDRRADVFAVGAILWRVITGQRLWKGMNDIEIYMHLTEKGVPSPRALRPDAPAELVAICERALDGDADRRFPTALALQQALEGYLERAGARVMPRQVGAVVAELFADERARVSAAIAARFSQGTPIEEAGGPTPPMMPAFGLPLDSEGKIISVGALEPVTSVMSNEQVQAIRTAGRPTARIGPELPPPRAPLSTDITAPVAMLTDSKAALLAADVDWPADSEAQQPAAPPPAPARGDAWPTRDAPARGDAWPTGNAASRGDAWPTGDAAALLAGRAAAAQVGPAWPAEPGAGEAAWPAGQAAQGAWPAGQAEYGSRGGPLASWPAGGALATGYGSAATSSAQRAAAMAPLSVEEATKALAAVSGDEAGRALAGWPKGPAGEWVRAMALPALAAFALAALVLVAKGMGLFSSSQGPSDEPAPLAGPAPAAGPFVLRVVPTPANARIVVDEHPLELGTASFPKGEARHRVSVEAPGYEPYADWVTLRGPQTTLRVTLKPKAAQGAAPAADVVRKEGPGG
ncbi:MAG TPA: protein kinase [Polyangiaceae bacterium]|nr:protein kinase [Polyangiaceae bacterium]